MRIRLIPIIGLISLIGCGGSEGDAGKARGGAALAFEAPTLADAAVGVDYEAKLEAGGGQAEGGYRWSLTDGALPAGLYLSSRGAPGKIYGRPSESGSYALEVRVEDAAGAQVERQLTLKVQPGAAPLEIATAALPAAGISSDYQASLAGRGGSDKGFSWAVSAGQLPPGIRLSKAGTPAGTLQGRPTEVGRFNFTIQLTDDAGHRARRSYGIEVTDDRRPLEITTAVTAVPDGVAGAPYEAVITAAYGAGSGYEWEVVGPLPEGLTLMSAAQNAIVRGKIQAAGSYRFVLRVTDAEGGTARRAFDILIAEAPEDLHITSFELPPAIEGQPYDVTLTARGGSGEGYRWEVTGDLPAGIRLEQGLGVGGVETHLRGTSTAELGTYDLRLRVTDSANNTREISVQLLLQERPGPLELPVQTLAGATTGTAYTQAITAARGVGAYGWAVTAGSLPPGLSLDPIGKPATSLRGYPTAVGDFTFTVTVFDGGNNQVSREFSLTVADGGGQPSFVTTSLPTMACLPYVARIEAQGGTNADYTWSVSAGQLPPGLRLIPDGRFAVIKGAPQVSANPADNSYSFSLTADDRLHPAATQAFSLTVQTADPAYIGVKGNLHPAQDYLGRPGLIRICGAGVTLGAAPLQVASGAATGEIEGMVMSPDASVMVAHGGLQVAARKDLFVVDTTQAAPQIRRVDGGSGVGEVTSFSLSPDGRKIAYRADHIHAGQQDLFVIDISDPQRVPVPQRITTGMVPGGDVAEPLVWSPDSRHIAFFADLAVDGEEQLLIADLSGAAPQVTAVPFTAAAAAEAVISHWIAWSPASDGLYFTGIVDGETQTALWRVPVGVTVGARQRVSAVGHDVQTGRNEAGHRTLSWAIAPTGDRLFYVNRVSGGQSSLQLVSLGASIGAPVAVTPSAAALDVNFAAWSPNGAYLAVVGDLFTENLRSIGQVVVADPTLAIKDLSQNTVQTPIVADRKLQLRWAPGSDQLFYMAGTSETRIDVYRQQVPANDAPISLTASLAQGKVQNYEVSPTGAVVTGEYERDWDTDPFIASADGQHIRFDDLVESPGGDYGRVFSVDGRYLYMLTGQTYDKALYRFDVSDMAALQAATEFPGLLISTVAARSLNALYAP